MWCLELRSPCVSLKIIAHLRMFDSQSDSSIQRPRSIKIDKWIVRKITIFAVGLHDISFRHRYRDVRIRNSHIAGCAMFSKPILFVIYTVYTDCFLCSHTDTASTPDATAVQRYPFLNKFSSRATARFQCWKSIYPLLKLPRCRGER